MACGGSCGCADCGAERRVVSTCTLEPGCVEPEGLAPSTPIHPSGGVKPRQRGGLGSRAAPARAARAPLTPPQAPQPRDAKDFDWDKRLYTRQAGLASTSIVDTAGTSTAEPGAAASEVPAGTRRAREASGGAGGMPARKTGPEVEIGSWGKRGKGGGDTQTEPGSQPKAGGRKKGAGGKAVGGAQPVMPPDGPPAAGPGVVQPGAAPEGGGEEGAGEGYDFHAATEAAIRETLANQGLPAPPPAQTDPDCQDCVCHCEPEAKIHIPGDTTGAARVLTPPQHATSPSPTFSRPVELGALPPAPGAFRTVPGVTVPAEAASSADAAEATSAPTLAAQLLGTDAAAPVLSGGTRLLEGSGPQVRPGPAVSAATSQPTISGRASVAGPVAVARGRDGARRLASGSIDAMASKDSAAAASDEAALAGGAGGGRGIAFTMRAGGQGLGGGPAGLGGGGAGPGGGRGPGGGPALIPMGRGAPHQAPPPPTAPQKPIGAGGSATGMRPRPPAMPPGTSGGGALQPSSGSGLLSGLPPVTPPSIEVRGSGAKDTLGVGEALSEARAGRRSIDTATPPEPGATSRVGGAGPSGQAPSSQRVAAVERASRARRTPLEPPQSTLDIERKAGPGVELPLGSKGGQVKGTFGEDLTLSPPQFAGRTALSDAGAAFLAPQDSRAGTPATVGHAGRPLRPAIVPPPYGGPSAAAARVLGSGQTRVGSSAVPTSLALHPGTTEPGAVVAEGAVAAALGRSRTPSPPGSRPGPVRASEGPAARSTGSMAVTGGASAGAQVQVGSAGSGITGSRGKGGSSQELERYAQGEERALALRRQVRDADAAARYYDGQGSRAGDEARAARERAEAEWVAKPNLAEPWQDPRANPHVAEGYTQAVRRESYAFQMAEHAKDARQALAREYLNEAEAQAELKQRLDRQLGSQWERRLEERQAREQSASARYQATRDRVTTDRLAGDVQRRADKRTLATFSGSPPTLGAAVRMVEGAKALGASHAERLRALDSLDQEQARLAREVPSTEVRKSGAKSGDAKALERLVADQGRRDQERRRLQRDQDRAAAKLASASGKLARLAGRAIDKFSARIAKKEAQLAKAQKEKPRPDPEKVARLAGEKQALEAALARVLDALRPPGAPPKPPPPLPQKAPPPPPPVKPPPPAIAPLPSDETIREFASPSLLFSARMPRSAWRAGLEEREVCASAWGGMERPVGGGADGVASPPHSPRLIGSSTEQSGVDVDGAPAAVPASGASSTGISVSPPAPAPCPPKCCNITCAAGMVCVCEKAAPSGGGGGGGGGGGADGPGADSRSLPGRVGGSPPPPPVTPSDSWTTQPGTIVAIPERPAPQQPALPPKLAPPLDPCSGLQDQLRAFMREEVQGLSNLARQVAGHLRAVAGTDGAAADANLPFGAYDDPWARKRLADGYALRQKHAVVDPSSPFVGAPPPADSGARFRGAASPYKVVVQVAALLAGLAEEQAAELMEKCLKLLSQFYGDVPKTSPDCQAEWQWFLRARAEYFRLKFLLRTLAVVLMMEREAELALLRGYTWNLRAYEYWLERIEGTWKHVRKLTRRGLMVPDPAGGLRVDEDFDPDALERAIAGARLETKLLEWAFQSVLQEYRAKGEISDEELRAGAQIAEAGGALLMGAMSAVESWNVQIREINGPAPELKLPERRRPDRGPDKPPGGRTGPPRRPWRHGDELRSRQDGIDLLTEQGLDPKKAADWWDSGDGTRTVERMVVGKRYRRYARVPGDEGKGYFLTELDAPVYRSGDDAARALDLKGRPPEYVQIVEITEPVYAIRSGIRKGAPDAVQFALPRKDVYRIVPGTEVPLNAR